MNLIIVLKAILKVFYNTRLIVMSVINMHDNISSMLLKNIFLKEITRFWNEILKRDL